MIKNISKNNKENYLIIETVTTNTDDIKPEYLFNENNNNSINENTKYKKLDYIDGEKIELGKTSKGFKIEQVNNVYYIDGYMLVNKSYPLPKEYVPSNTYESALNKKNTCNSCINNDVYKAFKDMQADALALGFNINITSGYRSYSTQNSIYSSYIARDGKIKADTYSARPGYSEHQTSLCFDLNSISDSFANTKEGKWVFDNSYKYGFIIRFPKNKEEYTGYKYESWHLRYVGEILAKELYNDGNYISMEEYFGIPSTYAN